MHPGVRTDLGATLQNLTITPASAGINVLWTATIGGCTAGSTVTATASNGTVLTVTGSGANRTVTGTFTAGGTPSVTTTEVLAGATNTPHATPPTTVVVGAVVDIANAAALATMLGAGVGASGGKVYRLAANTDFGLLDINTKDWTSNPITIFGQTGTKFSGIALTAAKGFTFKTFNVYDVAYSYAGIAASSGCDLITFDGVTIVYAAGAEGTPNNYIGLYMRNNPAATSLQFIGHSDSAIPDIWGFGNGMNLQDSQNVTIKGVTFGNNGSDHLLAAGVNFSTLDGLLNGTCYDPGHPDFIQLQTSGLTGLGCDNVTIKNCGMQRLPASTTGCQGYFAESATNLTVQDSWAYNAYGNACSISASDKVTWNNCYIQPVNDTGNGANITTRGASSNVTVENCYAGVINQLTDAGPNPNYVTGNNTLISAVNPGDFAALDVWLAANPKARRRY